MGDSGMRIPSIPHLRSTGGNHQLVVKDEPYLLLAGELQNSSLSCPEYMRTIWPKLIEANLNTVLGCVTWEMIEPEEGRFDFSRLDQIVFDARKHGMHLVLLWFGSFKNGKSTYTPRWVKQDSKRFPRAMLRKSGGRLETADVLSIFHTEAVKADAKAFARLMSHLRDIDEHYSTILMVQVQNEVGLLGDSRDGSMMANKCFASPVPKDLLTTLENSWDSLHVSLRNTLQLFHDGAGDNENSSWEAIFGVGAKTDELFMAYHYALFVEEIAAAGKSEYPLPLFTNVWQNYLDDSEDDVFPVIVGGGGQPGDYPSGGGVIDVLDIWQLFAPSLDFIGPDSYLNDYNTVCAVYKHRNQPLIIPEQRRDEHGARRIWSAFGTFGALCTAPFGIDTLEAADNPFKKHYGLLAQVSHYVLIAQSQPGSSFGFFFDPLTCDNKAKTWSVDLGMWNLLIERSFVFGKPGPGFGMVIQTGEARFLLVGQGFQVRFSSRLPNAHFTGILSFKEKVITNPNTGEMKDSRVLNGDETRSGELAIMPSDDPDYGDFPISITVPSRTSVAECEVYALVHE